MLGLILLFLLLLTAGIIFIAIGVSKLNITWLILGTVAIVISVIPVAIADMKEQKQIEESIREKCSENKGEVVEYSTTEWDVATKTNKTTVELFCLKDGKLNK